MKINEIVAERRKALGISQKEIASKIENNGKMGIRVATVSDFENGKKSLGSKMLEQVLELVGLEVV